MSVVLPGLGLSAPQPSIPQAPVSRIQRLEAGSEYRFEVAFGANVQVKLLNGTAEVFGTELAHNVAYTFSGTKAAVYTWHGCRLDVLGPCESEYSAEETPLTSYANVHFALEDLRTAAESGSGSGVGPRVLVVGPADAGKTSLARILTAYATKADRQPVVVNLDPRQGLLGVPGSLTAAAFATPPDVGEEGWGCSPVSGPTPAPVKTPLVYHYGLAGPEEAPKLFKPLVTRLALAVTSRLDEDPIVKASGCIIDTPGSISQGKGGSYEIIQHIVSEFSVNVLVVLGSERLYSDMSRRFSSQSSNPEDAVSVVKLAKSGGCVDRDEAYMKQLRHAQVRAYFFGSGEVSLSPYTQMADFGQLNIFRPLNASDSSHLSAFLPGTDEDDDFPAKSPSAIYERVQPSMMIQNCLLAITHAQPNDSHEVIRDSSVAGYVYVADVDEVKKTVKLLAPVSERVPARAMLLGRWPEDIADLVA